MTIKIIKEFTLTILLMVYATLIWLLPINWIIPLATLTIIGLTFFVHPMIFFRNQVKIWAMTMLIASILVAITGQIWMKVIYTMLLAGGSIITQNREWRFAWFGLLLITLSIRSIVQNTLARVAQFIGSNEFEV